MRHHHATRTRASAVCLALVCAAALCLVAVTGCALGTITASGSLKTETRDVTGFEHVALRGPGTLRILPAKTSRLTVTADKNVMPYITTEVQGNLLVIEVERSGLAVAVAPDVTIEFELRAPTITEIENSGSGRVSGETFQGVQMSLANSGSGEIELGGVEVVSLSTDISGSGRVSIASGTVGAQVVDVSGSGSFEAPDLKSRVATVRISGSGKAEVWATEGIDALVTGSGSVGYWGSPRPIEEITGSGTIEALGPKGSSSGS